MSIHPSANDGKPHRKTISFEVSNELYKLLKSAQHRAGTATMDEFCRDGATYLARALNVAANRGQIPRYHLDGEMQELKNAGIEHAVALYKGEKTWPPSVVDELPAPRVPECDTGVRLKVGERVLLGPIESIIEQGRE